MTFLAKEMVKNFRRMYAKGGVELTFGGEPVPAVVEPVSEQELPRAVGTSGTGTWVRLMAVREDLPVAAPPRKGDAFGGGGKIYRVAAFEGEPTDPIVALICSVAADTAGQ